MQQQPPVAVDAQQSLRIMQMLGLLLILSGLGAFVLGGIFSPQGYSQLTLGDNTTQASGGSNVWTDIAFDQTLTLSRYWRRDTGLTTFLSLSNGGVFDLYIAVGATPPPPTCNFFLRLMRQRGSDPSFYQVGVIETPVKQPNGMSLTVLDGLRTEAGDVYKLQWLTDCTQASLVPVAVDLGLLGVPNVGVQAISSYLIVLPTMSAATLPPPPPPTPTAAPTQAPTAGSGIMTINDIGPDPTSLNFQLIPGANVLFDQPVPNSLRINASSVQGPQGPPGRDASVTVSLLNLSNNTNVTETIYNATQFTVNITITENATFISTNCSCLHTVNTIGPDAQLDFTLLAGSGITLTPGTNALTIATTAIEKINGVTPDNGNNFALTTVGPLSVAGTAHGAQLSTTCVATIGGVTADSSNNIGLTVVSPLALTNTSHAWQLSTTLTQGIVAINSVGPDGTNNFLLTGTGHISIGALAHGAQVSSDGTPNNVNSTLVARDSSGSFAANQIVASALVGYDVTAEANLLVQGTSTLQGDVTAESVLVNGSFDMNGWFTMDSGTLQFVAHTGLSPFSIGVTGALRQGYVDATGATTVSQFASYQYYRLNNVVYSTIMSGTGGTGIVNATGPIILTGLFQLGYRTISDQYLGTIMLTDNGVVKLVRVKAIAATGDVQLINLDGSNFNTTVSLDVDNTANSMTAIFPTGI